MERCFSEPKLWRGMGGWGGVGAEVGKKALQMHAWCFLFNKVTEWLLCVGFIVCLLFQFLFVLVLFLLLTVFIMQNLLLLPMKELWFLAVLQITRRPPNHVFLGERQREISITECSYSGEENLLMLLSSKTSFSPQTIYMLFLRYMFHPPECEHVWPFIHWK